MGTGKKKGKKEKEALLTCFWLCRFGDRILSSFSFSEGEAILAVGVLNLECKTRHLSIWESRNFKVRIKKLGVIAGAAQPHLSAGRDKG